MNTRLNTRLRARRINNSIGTSPQSTLLDQPRRILLGAHPPTPKLMRRRILCRELQPLLINIHTDNLARAQSPRDRTTQQPHRSSPKHNHRLPALDARLPRDMHTHSQRLNQRPMLQRHALGQLVAEVLGHAVVFRQRAVVGRRRCKRHVGTEVVHALLAAHAAPTGDAGLERDRVADFERLYCIADAVYDAGGLVAEDHGGLDDELADFAVCPVVYIGAADAGEFDLDEDIVGGFQGWDGSVFESDAVGFFQHERQVLRCEVVSWELVVGLVGAD